MADLSFPRRNNIVVTTGTAESHRSAIFSAMAQGHVSLYLDGAYMTMAPEDAATLGRWLLAWCQPDVRVVCSDCPRP